MPPRSPAWPYLIASLVAVAAWQAMIRTSPSGYPWASSLVQPGAVVLAALLFAVSIALGFARGRDWRTAISMVATVFAAGIIIDAAANHLCLHSVWPWLARFVLFEPLPVLTGLLIGDLLAARMRLARLNRRAGAEAE